MIPGTQLFRAEKPLAEHRSKMPLAAWEEELHYFANMNAEGGAQRVLQADQVQRVLVAEDDAEVASKLARMVEIAGARPFVVATRCALLKTIATQVPFALVITEAVMAWITGVGVVPACVFEQQPPVVFVAPRELDLGARTSGSWFRVLRKPLVAEECIATFEELLSDATRSGVRPARIR